MVTRPGLHPDFDITQYPGEVRSAIREISLHFYVTRSFKSVRIGNSEYYGLLVRPTEDFAVYINTDREIVVLFATYDNFEIRTLEAYETIYDLLESKRVDRSLRFLVSADNRIESVIRHYLDQHPEYPIIIPTNFSEVNKRTGNTLLQAVRRNFLIRDLFGYQNPLREETFFFGRQSVVNSILDMAKSGQNSSLFGLRKSGKTSAIYAVQRKAKGMSCNVAVVDCQNPTVHARKYPELLSYIIVEIRRASGLKKITPDLGTDVVSVSDRFFEYMNNTLSQLKNVTLLIFDEIENISPKTASSRHWREENDVVYFWQILRSYIQSQGNGRISVCIVGTSPHLIEMTKINDIANPVYLYAQKNFMPSLSFNETKEMILKLGYFMGLEFSDQSVADIHREFGGHPFFTRQVCSKIHQDSSGNRPVRVSPAATQKAKDDFRGPLESYLRDIIDNLRQSYPDEFDLLVAVVNNEKEEINEYGRDAPDLIDHLIGYGLIERFDDSYDIRFQAIRSALSRIVTTDGRNERWAEISRRRNVLESAIRSSLFHWCRAVSIDDWAEIISTSLSVKRYSSLISTEPSFLFSSKNSPLYLSDLLLILKHDSCLPYISHTRSKIISSMDTVNKFRNDAHALKINDNDYKEVTLAFEFLESIFYEP